VEKVIDNKDYCTGWWLVFITISVMGAIELFIPERIAENHYYGVQFLKEGSIIIPCIIGFFHLLKRKELKAFKFSKLNVWLIPVICILPVVAGQFINVFTSPLNGVTSFLFGLVRGGKPERTSEIFFAIITMCIIAPILEELLFRGLLMHYFKDYGVVVSLMVSAVAFAIIDFSPDTFFNVLFIGILLGVVRIATDSLWACMLVHGIKNTIELILLFIPFIHQNITTAFLVISIIAFPVTLYLMLKLAPSEKRELIVYEPLKKTELSIGMILCMSTYIIYLMMIILIKLDIFLSGIMYIV